MGAYKKFIADFHTHSHYSIATSKNLIPEYIDYWAKIKGIDVIGTGDCIHPGWLSELKEKLEPADNGLFRLKKNNHINLINPYSKNNSSNTYYILTGEISSIYKKNEKVRKVHNLCIFPNFETVEKAQKKLSKIGNIESDGRPILGLDSKILLDIVKNSSDDSYLIPAHIWTPWFSVLGSKSGFDTIEECYEDLTQYIFAVETGLSSDPQMNWACSFLDQFKLVSNSDAHSPEKLGREANIFQTEMSYSGIYNSLSGDDGFLGTIEFFPQEGKYHYDGHRKCAICWNPLETLKHNGICPECNKPVTKGVMYRVAQLADRTELVDFKNKRDFYSITSLPDLLAELLNKKSTSTKTVRNEYFRLIEHLGPEFNILLFSKIDEIKKIGGEILAEGIKRLRNGNIIIDEGYDGEFGKIKVFHANELTSFAGPSIFSLAIDIEDNSDFKTKLSIKFNIEEFQTLYRKSVYDDDNNDILPEQTRFRKLSAEQKEAIEHFTGPCIILAGPGSGKTSILTERIIYLIENKKIDPKKILAITFSNKAAKEMLDRVKKQNKTIKSNICTFHAFGLSILKKYYKIFERPCHFYISDSEEKKEIIQKIAGKDKRKIQKLIKAIESYKQGITSETDIIIFEAYNRELQIRGAFDLEDLIYLPVELFKLKSDILNIYREKYLWLLVDEYQDINGKQYELVFLLTGYSNQNLFAIGDPDQSIYGFRGSDLKYIDKLQIDFPNIKKISLSKSYRCPTSIMRAAGQILGKQDYLTGNTENVKVHIQELETYKSEADWIALQIEMLMGGVRSFSIDSGITDGEACANSNSFSDFGILCRTSHMFDPIIKAFKDHGIAYQVIGTEPFYNKEPFNTILSHLRRIYYHLVNVESSALKLLNDEIRQMIMKKEKVYKILSFMMEKKKILEDDKKRMMELAKSFGNNYEKFFINLYTRQGVDEYDERSEAVSLLTLHASKGLEFNTVFIPGCEEGILPFELYSKKDKSEIEEEERLFYVGVTRTKRLLYLSHSKIRFFKGKILNQQKSPILNRLEKELINFGAPRPVKKRQEEIQLDLFE